MIEQNITKKYQIRTLPTTTKSQLSWYCAPLTIWDDMVTRASTTTMGAWTVMGGLETVIRCLKTTCNGNKKVMELIGVAIVHSDGKMVIICIGKSLGKWVCVWKILSWVNEPDPESPNTTRVTLFPIKKKKKLGLLVLGWKNQVHTGSILDWRDPGSSNFAGKITIWQLFVKSPCHHQVCLLGHQNSQLCVSSWVYHEFDNIGWVKPKYSMPYFFILVALTQNILQTCFLLNLWIKMWPLQLQLILDSFSVSTGSVAATVGESYYIC